MALIAADLGLTTSGCPSQRREDSSPDVVADGKTIDVSPYVSQKDGLSTLSLIVQGAHCGGCVAKIEKHIGAISGMEKARMNLSAMRLDLVWQTHECLAERVIQKLSELGYRAAPYNISAAQSLSLNTQKDLLKAMALAGFAAMNVMLLSIAVWSGGGEMQASTQTIFHWLSALIALPVIAYSGRPFFKSAWTALRHGQTNMDVPISLAITLACSLSLYETVNGNPDTYFDAALMLVFLLLIGRYLDARLKSKTGEAALKLATMQSTSAIRVLGNGRLETVSSNRVDPEDILLVPAGQRIPVDSKIIEGTSDIDVQIATGETAPNTYGPGDYIFSGTLNLSAPLTVRVVAAESESFLSEITKLVELGEQGKSKYVRIADRAARLYVPTVHTLAIITFIGWLLVGAGLRPAAINAIAVLIITCPCALGLAVPAVQIVASGELFKRGVLLKSGDALERLAEINWVVFDKTGTLTKGEFKLVNGTELNAQDIHMAAALAQHSAHPISKALHTIETPFKASAVNEIPGQGLCGVIDGQSVSFGMVHTEKGGSCGYSISRLTVGNRRVDFLFSDIIRPEARHVVADLKTIGLTSELLSGDRHSVAHKLATEIGIERVNGDVTPKGKQSILYQRKSEGRLALMVGDGINDAPALAAAHASVTLASGSDISRAAADVVLRTDNLETMPNLIKIARRAQVRVKENLSLAVIYNLLAIPLAVFGFVNPLIAALAMSGSSLLVTLNALRMRIL